ncbi:hypothetical protein [Novosphingobium sp. Gsoil 351]|uniref:hypothetical protein n=1 Tax=Novosphingobium sp. Gsoil 351 TaxID=2675225 RepID=UPI0012B45E9B|nr:hypothetical protein [Novosphingobium sp. Gsoil 351]QGN54064.1 hypothetical protein GKE62_05430 [Novosphingobium sp. Gsoil 351]
MSFQPLFANAQVLNCNAQLDALKAQFGSIVASRILEAEAADFHWQARVRERYLGQYCDDVFGSGEELSRIAILSQLGGQWHAGVCLADGDGEVETLLWLRSFGDLEGAEGEYDRAH